MSRDVDNDRKFNEFIKDVVGKVKMQDEGVHLANPDAYANFERAVMIANNLASEIDATVKSEHGVIITSLSAITIEASDFTVRNTKLLCKLLASSAGWEMYPLTNGRVRLALDYPNMTKKID